jgi:hypothetical protein
MVVTWLHKIDGSKVDHPIKGLLINGWNMFVGLLRPTYGAGRTYEKDENERG